MTAFLDWLAALPPFWVVVAAGVLVFGECTLGLGFIAPGETGLFVLGTTATSPPAFVGMWLVTTVCAVGGDSVGFLLGRRYGTRLRESKIVRRHGARHWDRATDFLRRRGAVAVLVAIFLPVLRTVLPAAAGAAGLPYRTFLPAVLVGATGWCALHIGLGAAAGETARKIEKVVGTGSMVVAAVVVVVAVIAVRSGIEKHRAKDDA
ncbi:DedA family protein [Lentzea cavernae]|uniref:Membrane protein n=1 Tax=Lentzea cavernae TaxID=2020703 RepID=A0ABQ3M6M2_9PSEU|nr:DedA family protein [Lentzea cavernae]GHH28256.1 membrane protein [Lentzea cavernae]